MTNKKKIRLGLASLTTGLVLGLAGVAFTATPAAAEVGVVEADVFCDFPIAAVPVFTMASATFDFTPANIPAIQPRCASGALVQGNQMVVWTSCNVRCATFSCCGSHWNLCQYVPGSYIQECPCGDARLL